MVKYWPDRVKFWIYTAFRAFRTSHQLLLLVVMYRSNRGMQMQYDTIKGSKSLTSFFVTILRDGEINNIIILQHQKPWCFSPINLRVQGGYQFFSLKEPFAWEFFVIFFHMPVRILSLISVKTTEGHLWNCIIFFFIFKKEKKWNETRWEWNLVLNNEMRIWMTWKRSLAFNNDDGKTLYKKTNKSIYKKK